MAELVLFDITDVQEYNYISSNFDENRFNSIARNCQQTNLKDLLGDALYYDLIQNSTDTKYNELINGKSYTYQGNSIQYYGLKPYLSFMWLANNMLIGDSFQADYGNVVFSDNPQDNMRKMSFAEKQAAKDDFMERSVIYRNGIVQFLNENSATYPHWEGGASNQKRSSFKIHTI